MQTIFWTLFSALFLMCRINANEEDQLNSEKNHNYVITSIPSDGLVIDSPGNYIFGNEITWTPKGNGQAILITSTDVILDLKEYTLNCQSNNWNTTGIVAFMVANPVIKNGTIKGMALGGIHCDTSTNIFIENVTVDGLNRKNTATYTVPTGILVTTSTDVFINNCTVKNINVKTGSTAAIQLTEVVSSKVTNCVVQNLLNQDGACTGIGHLACDKAKVKGCQIDGLEAQFINNLNTEGHTAIGMVPVLSTNLKISKCTISNITGCCDDAHGMSVFECLGALIKKCQVKNVLDGAGAAQTGAKATGIEIYASGVKVINCQVDHISAINPQDKQATGFSCAQCADVKFIGCHASHVNVFDENGEQSSAIGYGTGFGWAPDPRPEFILPAINILYKNCTAKECQVGFDSFFHIDSVWEDLISEKNGISVLNLNQSKRTLSCDACSECGCLQVGCYPTPREVTIDNIAENNRFSHIKALYSKNGEH